MAMGWLMGSMLWRLMWSSSGIALLRRTTIVYGSLRLLLGRLTMKIWDAIRICRRTLWLIIMSSIVVRMTILAASRLRHVRDDLHAAGNDTGRPSTSSSIRRSCGAAEALGQLLHKRLPNVVSSDVHSICDTKDHERSLGGEGQAGVGRVETGARCFLNLANAYARLPDDRADQDVRNKQTQGVRLGLGGRRSLKRLVVQCPYDEPESLCSSALET